MNRYRARWIGGERERDSSAFAQQCWPIKMTVRAETIPSALHHVEKLVLFSRHLKFFIETLKMVFLSTVNIQGNEKSSQTYLLSNLSLKT